MCNFQQRKCGRGWPRLAYYFLTRGALKRRPLNILCLGMKAPTQHDLEGQA
jgi:hypothetical protein